jgi:hypothetical protein
MPTVEKLHDALEARKARMAELVEEIESLAAEEDVELRESFLAAPDKRQDATSRIGVIRRGLKTRRDELASLERDLPAIEQEVHKAAAAANAKDADAALKRYREFERTEAAFYAELRAQMLSVVAKQLSELPQMWAARDEAEATAAKLAAQAGVSADFDHVRDQLRARALPQDALSWIEKAVKSLRLAEFEGDARAALEQNPWLLWRFVDPEHSPAYHEPKESSYVWIDLTSAPLVMDGGRGVRAWQGDDGKVHPSVQYRRTEPSEAEQSAMCSRTGVARFLRVDAEMVQRP